MASFRRLMSCCLIKLLSFRSMAHFCRQAVPTTTPTAEAAPGSPGVAGTAAGQPTGNRTTTGDLTTTSESARQREEGETGADGDET